LKLCDESLINGICHTLEKDLLYAWKSFDPMRS
jgi:hypothetical protein